MAKANKATNETTGAEAQKQYKRGKALVVPTLSIKDMKKGDSLHVKFSAEPVTRIQTTKDGKPKLDPDTGEEMRITSAQVTDLDTGALGELVLGFMVMKGLAPMAPLTGKCFELVKGDKAGRTQLWEVYEIEEA